MKNAKLTIATLLASGALGLAACGGGSVSSPRVELPTPPPPPPPISYTTFVKDQFAATADNTDPAEINDIDFAFDNADDPGAFDDLLQTP